MATDLRRFTISVTPTMETDLDRVKKECYYKSTQNEMIRDLIIHGLETLQLNQEENSKDRSVCGLILRKNRQILQNRPRCFMAMV